MTEEEKLEKQYEVILKTRNFEIDLFWRRSLFFWGFIASAFVGYAALGKNGDSNESNEFARLIVTCFGLFCSFAWVLINIGGKYWQENWEMWLEDDRYGEIFGGLFQQRKSDRICFSPSKTNLWLSYFTAAIWFFLLGDLIIKDIEGNSNFSENISTVCLKITSIAFTAIMMFATCYDTHRKYTPGILSKTGHPLIQKIDDDNGKANKFFKCLLCSAISLGLLVSVFLLWWICREVCS